MRNCIFRSSGSWGVPGLEHVLDLDGTLHRSHRTPELHKEVVPSEVHELSPVLVDEKLDLLSVGGDQPDRSVLVLRHEPAVADHIGVKDGG